MTPKDLQSAAIKTAIVATACEVVVGRKAINKELFFNDYESITFSLQEVMDVIESAHTSVKEFAYSFPIEHDYYSDSIKLAIKLNILKNEQIPITIDDVVSCVIGLSTTNSISFVRLADNKEAIDLLNGEINEETIKKELLFKSDASSQVLMYTKYVLKAFQEQSLAPLEQLRKVAVFQHSMKMKFLSLYI